MITPVLRGLVDAAYRIHENGRLSDSGLAAVEEVCAAYLFDQRIANMEEILRGTDCVIASLFDGTLEEREAAQNNEE